MRYVLAIDGGGTKTQVWCADEHGAVIGQGHSGAASLVVMNPHAAVQNVRQAVTQALSGLPVDAKISQACMGLAGVDIPVEVAKAHDIFQSISQLQHGFPLEIVNDVEIALAASAKLPNAIALISGTGSNCFGRNAAGLTARSSGLDYVLADQGSGYALGLSTLQAAVKSYDGRLPKTQLEELVCQHFGVESVPELKLKVYHPPLTKTAIASLAKLTEKALLMGDAQAQVLFDKLALELVSLVQAVINRLSLQDTAAELCLFGGMFRVQYLENQVTRALEHRYPHLHCLKPQDPPVKGALTLALNHLK